MVISYEYHIVHLAIIMMANPIRPDGIHPGRGISVPSIAMRWEWGRVSFRAASIPALISEKLMYSL
ncbi:conserved hypothetical protein [Ricinus communis]|uniref:Uncharacterized protein n=1 Tax=Ricinus communis TaxID=3988 RepID=B9SFG6_RICCO|nr:conserved hypothetical protein [Ricinus communis]